MQFLTVAVFLIAYIRTLKCSGLRRRSWFNRKNLWESRLLGPFLGSIGLASIAWFFLGRRDQFGTVFADRYLSYIDLLSIERVGSISFLVDLTIFGLFQGGLVDDDMKRRGVDVAGGEYRQICSFLWFSCVLCG